ncbi:MAG: S1/P1 nuclease [Bacteroidota bacterium]
MKIFLLLIVLGTLPAPVRAWWDTGHMTVAAVAYTRLTPAVRTWVDELIPVLTAHYSGTRNFIESATWPDDIKNDGVYIYSALHYTNIPYNPDGVALPAHAQPEINVVSAIKTMAIILRSRKAIALEKARALAFLVHFVGDIHQPLHTTSMYTKEQPEGNLGGNRFRLSDSAHNSLHKLWDDGCGFFDPWKPQISREPWGEPTEKALLAIADSVARLYPESEMPAARNLDPVIWAEEGHALAVKYGYEGVQLIDGEGIKIPIRPGDDPSALYLGAGQKIVQQQVALAGYRLARMLNEIHDGGADD